ncbi:hypothetical protein AVEN_216773-1 [Araneus ventricosus]|uniref:Uncharacterized protein n=1 Tax=Araneus ventricosus TaxID=182803 RepID=A0A4Y2LPF3_ARAVE|nr:hypothetical protein AVEN_162909-1 [Araneus ventricosus]GBN16329.1 hypothetical protein AVEN_70878-1 [Araneus ventricosus]GBN16346.1 hypothetical protein AVEN_120015-1 [Araneus ventricosus]GBN16373.1 hypothetical protein AVEN_216773-1 [Araneus ventricosus]
MQFHNFQKVSSFNRTALLHTTTIIVREFLDTTFPQRWIGKGAVLACPPRSPDITPLDFYLWGYVKQHVYSECINDINHLKQRITTLFTLLHQMSLPVWGKNWTIVEMCVEQQVEPTSNCDEQACKPGEFSFYLVKMSPVYLVPLLSCDQCTMTLRTHYIIKR